MTDFVNIYQYYAQVIVCASRNTQDMLEGLSNSSWAQNGYLKASEQLAREYGQGDEALEREMIELCRSQEGEFKKRSRSAEVEFPSVAIHEAENLCAFLGVPVQGFPHDMALYQYKNIWVDPAKEETNIYVSKNEIWDQLNRIIALEDIPSLYGCNPFQEALDKLEAVSLEALERAGCENRQPTSSQIVYHAAVDHMTKAWTEAQKHEPQAQKLGFPNCGL